VIRGLPGDDLDRSLPRTLLIRHVAIYDRGDGALQAIAGTP
jgi:hypothetical protein